MGSLGMGGAERVALDLASAQQELGHTVLVISLAMGEQGPLAPLFAEAGIEVHAVAKKPGLDWTLPPRVARKLRQLRVDVVHTHNTQPLVYAACVSRLSRHAVIHSKHGEGHLVSAAGQFLRRLGAPFVHRFVAVSEMTAEHARKQWAYPLPSRIRVITNGIRLDGFAPDADARDQVRRELGISQDAWLFGTIGRCDANKNQRALVEVLEGLPGDAHLAIIGEGESFAALQEAVAKSAAHQRIHLLGRRSDVARVLAAFDAFALPSLSEGLPLVILEAMATALPIVSNEVGGIAKVIDEGATGFLVPAGDVAAMMAKLCLLHTDRPRCRAMGEAARATAQAHYSARRMAEEYLELYQQALGGRALRH